MPSSDESTPEPEADSRSPVVEVRYSLSDLLREVKRDRSSAVFAMEKLDQATISLLFEHEQSRRDANSGK